MPLQQVTQCSTDIDEIGSESISAPAAAPYQTSSSSCSAGAPLSEAELSALACEGNLGDLAVTCAPFLNLVLSTSTGRLAPRIPNDYFRFNQHRLTPESGALVPYDPAKARAAVSLQQQDDPLGSGPGDFVMLDGPAVAEVFESDGTAAPMETS